MAKKKLRQVKVLLLKDTLPDPESALRPDDDGNTHRNMTSLTTCRLRAPSTSVR